MATKKREMTGLKLGVGTLPPNGNLPSCVKKAIAFLDGLAWEEARTLAELSDELGFMGPRTLGHHCSNRALKPYRIKIGNRIYYANKETAAAYREEPTNGEG